MCLGAPVPQSRACGGPFALSSPTSAVFRHLAGTARAAPPAALCPQLSLQLPHHEGGMVGVSSPPPQSSPRSGAVLGAISPPLPDQGLCCPFGATAAFQPGSLLAGGERSAPCRLNDKSPRVAAGGRAALTASLLLIHFARFLLASFLLGSDQAGTAVNRAVTSC